MASPVCQVKEGAGAYQATTNGIDVAASASVTIKLNDVAGVNLWSIACVDTDEVQDPATITAGLTIDSVAKTATFTAPADLGTALIFESKVNNGIGSDGTADPSLTTRFAIHILTAASLRVGALNETTEAGVDGWMRKFNEKVRQAAGGGGGTTGSANEVQTTDGAGNHQAATNVLAGTGYISVGPTPATAGAIRLPNATLMYARNAANSADVKLAYVDASDRPVFGDDAGSYVRAGADVWATATGEMRFTVGAAQLVDLYVGGTREFRFGAGYMSIGTTVAASGVIRLGGAWSIVTAGGSDQTVMSHDGGYGLQLGSSATSATNVIGGNATQITQSATLVADFRSSGSFINHPIQFGASVDVGSGTGGGVIGIDGAGTNPSTNPTGGIVLYVDAADSYKLKYRNPAGSTITLDGAGGASPGGSADEVQVNNGAGGFAGATNVKAGSGYASIGTNPNTTDGLVRFGETNTAGTTTLISGRSYWTLSWVDKPILEVTNGYSLRLGEEDSFDLDVYGQTVASWAKSSTSFIWFAGSSGVTSMRLSTTGLGVGYNIASGAIDGGGGLGVFVLKNANTNPSTNPTGHIVCYSDGGDGSRLKYRNPNGSTVYLDGTIRGTALHTFGSDANYTVTAAQHDSPMIQFGTGSWTVGRTVFFPAPSGYGDSYQKTVINNTSYTMTVDVVGSPGTTRTIPTNQVAVLMMDASGVRYVSGPQAV